MSNKHLERSAIPQHVAGKKAATVYLDQNISELHRWDSEKDPHVLVSIRYVQHDNQCFSSWTRDEMKAYWSFQERLSSMSWGTLYSSGGKGANKAGMAYTPISLEQYPECDFKKTLSPDITLFEVRASEKIRVHGFRNKSIFFVCWLDRNHDLLK